MKSKSKSSTDWIKKHAAEPRIKILLFHKGILISLWELTTQSAAIKKRAIMDFSPLSCV